MIYDWQKSLADGVNTDIPRDVYYLDEPIVIAPRSDPIVTGNRAILVTHDDGMDALVASGAVRIRDLRFMTTAERGGAAFRCQPEYQISGLELSHVEVIHSGLQEHGTFETGIALDNCWNSTLDVAIQGYPWDYTDAALLTPRMAVALDLGNCQEARVKYQIGGAGIGISSISRAQGDAEGLVLEGRWTQSCRRCIQLYGGVYGGFQTPHAHIGGATHGFYTQEFLFALHRHGLVVNGANCCGSHLDENGTTAIWLVDCPDAKVVNNTIWRTALGPLPWPDAFGIVFDQTDGAVIDCNTITAMIDLGIYQTASCRNIKLGLNLNRAKRPS
jgi:hypothetical protein